MKKTSKLLILFAMMLSTFGLWFNYFNKNIKTEETHVLKKAPIQAEVVLYTKTMECELERIYIKQVSNNHEVKGSNYLKAWLVEFKTHNGNDFEANQIVNTEDPVSQGQDYFVASSCKVSKSPENASKDCSGMYLWDKTRFTISRQCGQIIDEKVFFIR